MSDVQRFIQAQKCYYSRALEEVQNGRKESHWIWYIFPQLKGLGYSSEAQKYGIDGRSEAEEYMKDPVLRERLIEITQALLDCGKEDASEVFGYPDDMKVRSCMTLFREVCPEEKVFDEVIQKFYGGEPDEKTLDMLNGY